MKNLTLTLLATLVCGAVMAQEAQLSPHGATINAESDGISPNFVWTNLNPSPFQLFSLTSPGRNVLGPSNSLGLPQQSAAIAFVPRVGSRARTLKAAVQWISGAKRVKLAIYTDAQGVPGTPVPGGQGVTTVIPTYLSCCALAEVTLPGGGARVIAGTKYWLVALSDPLAPDFTGKWLDTGIATNADKTGTNSWVGTDLQWGAGEVDGAAEGACDCGSGATCVCNGSNPCACQGAGSLGSLEELFSLACSNSTMSFYPDFPFTLDKVTEMFSGLRDFSVRVKDNGAVQIINNLPKAQR